MDVGEWLRSLGLGQYEANFRDNKIDVDVLADLTAGDLEKLGLPLGDRKRLLKAIASLVGLPSTTGKSEPVPTHTPSAAAQSISAERRPITVMFCDLVGSTSLAAKLDAEDWRNLVGAYLDEASKAVTELGGHMLKKLGDGLMALFGYPHAQENDAERAVRAALAIQRALAELNTRNAGRGVPQLVARIGLESGPVVVNSTGEVFGDAPNLAARVQAAADPARCSSPLPCSARWRGCSSPRTRARTNSRACPSRSRSTASCGRAGAAGAAGRGPAAPSWVARRSSTSSRGAGSARFCRGQFVQIVGEPGIGKSRLIEEFHARLGETPHTWVEWSSSQLLQNTPLHSIAEWGRQRFGDAETPAGQRFADLEYTLQLVGLDPRRTCPAARPARRHPPAAGPRRQPAARRAPAKAARGADRLGSAGARSQPVAFAFEDLHWADPTSLDLMQALAERGHQAPLFILATTRPEFRALWSLRSHHSVISLSPLSEENRSIAECRGRSRCRRSRLRPGSIGSAARWRA